VSFAHLPHVLGLGALLFFLSGLIFVHLRGSNLSSFQASALGGLSLVQPGYLDGNVGISAALLALATLAVGLATLAFVKRQDPRRTVLLGGSLAAAQIVHPLWGTAATIVLPFTLHRSLGVSAERVTGLYVSLLFLPAITSILLVCLTATGDLDPPRWPSLSDMPGKISLLSAASTVLAGSVFLIASTVSLRGAGLAALAVTGTLVLFTSVGLQMVDHSAQILPCAAAMSVSLLLVLVPSSKSTVHFRTAIAVVTANAAFSWALPFLTRLGQSE